MKRVPPVRIPVLSEGAATWLPGLDTQQLPAQWAHRGELQVVEAAVSRSVPRALTEAVRLVDATITEELRQSRAGPSVVRRGVGHQVMHQHEVAGLRDHLDRLWEQVRELSPSVVALPAAGDRP
jgi:hypothetical protein